MYVIDANVIIDFRDSDLNILSLFSQKAGQIIVPTLIADEVHRVSNEQFQQLGLQIYEPETSELLLAYSQPGGLSRQDYLCLILAQKYQWSCITNEKLLRNECERNNIKTIRGLRLLIHLYQNKHISQAKADEVALMIQTANPLHITESIIQEFRTHLN